MIDFETEVPSVALDFMNDDHRDVTELVNAIERQLETAEPQQITAQLIELLQHCQAHFERENQQMIDYEFPPYGCHKKEHDRVLADIELMIEGWQQVHDRGLLRCHLAEDFKHWLLNHVQTMDAITAQFVISKQ